MGRLFRICCLGALFAVLIAAGPAWAVVAQSVQLYNRDVAELRAVLGGLTPAERAARAQRRWAALSDADLAQPLTLQAFDSGGQRGYTLQVNGHPLFTLLETDLDPEERLPLLAAAERALRQSQAALDARRRQAEWRTWVSGGLVAAGVLAGWAVVVALASRLHRRLEQRTQADAQRGTALAVLQVLWRRGLSAAVWLLALALGFAGLLLLLEAFPWTEPWGDGLVAWVHALGGWLVGSAMAAVPGLLTVLAIVLLARAVQDVLGVFMHQVQDGRLRLPFLHADTVGATRRLLVVLVWGIAFAVAYPFLPGSDSDAFKGLSVLFGLMVTLGSTGVVTQLMSGLVIIYSRSLRKGDFVAVNGVEGVVSEVGALAVKVTTMRNEEVTLPNAVITGSPIHNYSKLGTHQGTLVSTKITIGYDAPWRQVHAMLVNAAQATAGVRSAPAPFVYQRALSDFYVEYELFAHIDRPLERVAIVSALHAAIQDEFNTHGVQIMSPNFYDQPPQPLVVPRDRWYTAPARPPD